MLFFATVGTETDLVQAAYYTSIGDPSAESEAIFAQAMGLRLGINLPKGSRFVPSGIDFKDRKLRRGSLEEIESWLTSNGAQIHLETREIVSQVQARHHQAIVIADHEKDLGVIELI